jgi:hypothetical protein
VTSEVKIEVETTFVTLQVNLLATDEKSSNEYSHVMSKEVIEVMLRVKMRKIRLKIRK